MELLIERINELEEEIEKLHHQNNIYKVLHDDQEKLKDNLDQANVIISMQKNEILFQRKNYANEMELCFQFSLIILFMQAICPFVFISILLYTGLTLLLFAMSCQYKDRVLELKSMYKIK